MLILHQKDLCILLLSSKVLAYEHLSVVTYSSTFRIKPSMCLRGKRETVHEYFYPAHPIKVREYEMTIFPSSMYFQSVCASSRFCKVSNCFRLLFYWKKKICCRLISVRNEWCFTLVSFYSIIFHNSFDSYQDSRSIAREPQTITDHRLTVGSTAQYGNIFLRRYVNSFWTK